MLMMMMAIVVAACSGGKSGDLESYCALLQDGVGLQSANTPVQEPEFEQLLGVAPSDVRDAVRELSNTTRSLEEIKELDQLFDVAFDPAAQAARRRFNEHATQVCGINRGELILSATTSADVIADLRAYADDNFGGSSWLPKVRYDVKFEGEDLVGIDVTFVVDARDDETAQACAAVSVYFYELLEAIGEVSVINEGLVAVRRTGSLAPCNAL